MDIIRKVVLTMDGQQKYEVIKKLVETNGNKDRAALTLGLSKRQINRLITAYREHWAGLGSYSEEEGMAKAEKDKEKVLAELKERYGFGKPDSERMEIYHEYDEEGDARQARYVFTYGILTVDVLWDLADERMASVEMLEF